ncbi:MAG: DoxX family membrane protein [Bacteroidota bacterium]
MKIAAIIVRTLLGVLFIYASVMFFLKKAPETEVTGDFKAFQVGMIASHYLMPLAKGLELICGLAFLSGRYVTLASIIILPVTLNILLININMTPDYLPLGILVFAGNLFLIYYYRQNYKSLFAAT